MDEHMENPTPGPDDQSQGQPEQPQPSPPSEYGETAPPVPEPPAPQAEGPQPTPSSDMSKDERMWGMICHLAALAMFTSIPFANVLGPLIVWLIKKEDFAFVNDQGKESLNFQISVSIYVLCCLPLMCLAGIGVFLAAALGIADLVFVIIAAIKSNEGQTYRYPCCIRLVK